MPLCFISPFYVPTLHSLYPSPTLNSSSSSQVFLGSSSLKLSLVPATATTPSFLCASSGLCKHTLIPVHIIVCLHVSLPYEAVNNNWPCLTDRPSAPPSHSAQGPRALFKESAAQGLQLHMSPRGPQSLDSHPSTSLTPAYLLWTTNSPGMRFGPPPLFPSFCRSCLPQLQAEV